jgi:hypothetical protein
MPSVSVSVSVSGGVRRGSGKDISALSSIILAGREQGQDRLGCSTGPVDG